MSHYFETPDEPLVTRTIDATIFGNDLTFTTARGVFSGARLDPGTSVLLREIDPPSEGHILDLGCGFGPIAVGLAVASPKVTVDAVDVNTHAVALTNMNAEAHGVADRVRAGADADGPFDEIWSNPPIRIGKDALHALLLRWLPRLRQDGTAWMVVSKNLGGDSLARWLNDEGWPTEKVASAKGFRVLRTTWAREYSG